MIESREHWTDEEWIAQAMIEQEDYGRMLPGTRKEIERIHARATVRPQILDILEAQDKS